MTNVSYNQTDSLVEILRGNGAVFDYMDGMQLVGNFGSPIGEYDSIRHDNTVSDRSHFGLLKVNGKDALELLNRLSTNKVVDLPSGQGASTILTNNKGRIIDRLLVSNLGDYSLVFTSPGRSASVMDWIDTYTFGEDIAIQDIGCQKSIISITESKTPGLLDRSMYPVELYASSTCSVFGIESCIVRSDHAGVIGYDLIVSKDDAPSLWGSVLDQGAIAVGEQALEMVRLEQGIPKFGHEIGEEFNPLEANLEPSISYDKGCYIGQEVVLRLKTYDKVQRHLMGITISGDGVFPRNIVKTSGEEIGFITSMAYSPILNSKFALSYIKGKHAYHNLEVQVDADGNLIPGKLVSLPIT